MHEELDEGETVNDVHWLHLWSSGGCHGAVCKMCQCKLHEHFDHAKGYGILGYSGHAPDCDAIQAGLCVDYNTILKQEYDALSPDEKFVHDTMKRLAETIVSQWIGRSGTHWV